MTTAKDKSESTFFNSVFFLFCGIAGLSAWNALLTALDFFSAQWKERGQDVSFMLPIPSTVANPLINLWLLLWPRAMHLNTRVYGGLGLTAVCLAVLPVIASSMKGQDMGYYLMFPAIFILASANALVQVSLTGFTTQFPPKYITLMFTGTGVSGLVMNGLRIIINLTVSDQEGVMPVLVYFVASGLISVVTMFMYHKFRNSEYCTNYLFLLSAESPSIIASENEGNTSGASYTLHQERDVTQSVVSEMITKPRDADKTIGDEISNLLHLAVKISPYPLLMVVIYVQTLSLFPGVSCFKRSITFLTPAWSPLLLLTAFNLFDTIGKSIGDMRSLYSKTTVIIMVLLRFLFIPAYLYAITGEPGSYFNNDYFHIITHVLCAATNGFLTGALFCLAQEVMTDDQKEKGGFLMVFCLMLGITLGVFSSLTMKGVIPAPIPVPEL